MPVRAAASAPPPPEKIEVFIDDKPVLVSVQGVFTVFARSSVGCFGDLVLSAESLNLFMKLIEREDR